MMNTKENAGIAELRGFLGEERFRRLVGQVRRLAASNAPKLHYWHERVLGQFEATSSLRFPRSAVALAAMVDDSIPTPPCLEESDVPAWIVIEELDGACPVQGVGVVYLAEGAPAGDQWVPWRWYFRARGEHWSIGAAAEDIDPVDVVAESGATLGAVFFHEEAYESRTGEYDAGYMPEAAARFYIVRELARLRRERKA